MESKYQESAATWKSRYPFDAYTVSYLLLWAFLFSGVFYLSYYHPVTYVRLVSEDEWLESWTAICLFAAAIIAFELSWRHGARPHKAIWLSIGLVFFFIAGEEISWGQRIFGFETDGLRLESSLYDHPNIVARFIPARID